jgi:hypothetical protein
MSANSEVLISGQTGERVTIRRITAIGSEGWFGAEVEVQCDGWHGKFGASFIQGELSRFERELRILHEQLNGKVILAPLEPNLELSFIGGGKGHIEVKGTARNNFHTGTELSFRLDLDQTHLPSIARAFGRGRFLAQYVGIPA